MKISDIVKFIITILVLIGLVFIFASLDRAFMQDGAPQSASVDESTKILVQNPFDNIDLTAKSAVVYDTKTGKVIFGKNETAQLPLASITKLLTTYYVLSKNENGETEIDNHALSTDGDSGLFLNEEWNNKDLATFALIASSNDAAEAMMTDDYSNLASVSTALGLDQTYAVNPTGLDENSTAGGYGSAVDVAHLIYSFYKKFPDVLSQTTHTSKEFISDSGFYHDAINTNQHIASVPQALGSKTGYTDMAGGNLAIIFDAGLNRPIAIVVLGSTREDRFTDVQKLLNATLEYFVNHAS